MRSGQTHAEMKTLTETEIDYVIIVLRILRNPKGNAMSLQGKLVNRLLLKIICQFQYLNLIPGIPLL